MFKKTTLKNGLRIITVPQRNTRTVTTLILVGTGSKYETKEINGISHFLEHMFFKGTKKRPSKMAISEILDGVGGDYNAFTGEEYTGYYAKVEKSHFDLALDVISDIFLNSKLEEKEIKKEKGVIIEEINMYRDHPSRYIQTLWTKLLYGDQPAGWDIAGTKKTVSAVNHQKLANYMKNQYVAENTVICVAGNINQKSAIEKVKKQFQGINITKPIEKLNVIEKQIKPACLLDYKKTDQVHLYLGVRGYNIFHPQKYTQDLLGVILGGMMSSRLFIKVRERLGAAYYIKTDVSADTDTGYFATCAGVANKLVEKSIKGILEEYKKISIEKVSPKELKKAKDFIKGKTALSLESSDAQASFYSLQELLKNEILSPEEILKKIDRVKANDILKIAKNLFQERKLNLALIGPFKNKEKFQQLLKL